MDLKNRQLQAIERMLNLNPAAGSGGVGLAADASASPQDWKVLVYDAAGRDIISPLLNVAQLRKCGVTLHMLLDSEREPIPDVPAVYFCRPTLENIKRIASDCRWVGDRRTESYSLAITHASCGSGRPRERPVC